MSTQAHLVELQKRHAELEQKLDKMVLHPSSDSLQVKELKQQKLALKDEMVRIENKTADDSSE